MYNQQFKHFLICLMKLLTIQLLPPHCHRQQQEMMDSSLLMNLIRTNFRITQLTLSDLPSVTRLLTRGNTLVLVTTIMLCLRTVVLEDLQILEILNRYPSLMVVSMHQVLMNLATLRLVTLLTLKTEQVISPLVVLLKFQKLVSLRLQVVQLPLKDLEQKLILTQLNLVVLLLVLLMLFCPHKEQFINTSITN